MSHEVEPEQFEPGIPAARQPRSHLLDLSFQDATLVFGAGLSDRLALQVDLPFRRVHVDAAFEDQAGRPLPGFESIHHRTETLTGIGDVGVWLGARAGQLGSWSVDVRGGVTVPTGGTEEDPFHLGEEGERHQHIFFGTGTWDPQLGTDLSRALGSWDLFGWGRARIPLGDNSEGYRAGARLSAGLAAGRPLGSSPWRIRGQVEGYHEEPSKWSGTDARNSGRTDLLAAVALDYSPAERTWGAHGLVRVPFNLDARGGQLDLAPIVSVGISVRMNRGP